MAGFFLWFPRSPPLVLPPGGRPPVLHLGQPPGEAAGQREGPAGGGAALRGGDADGLHLSGDPAQNRAELSKCRWDMVGSPFVDVALRIVG